MLLWCLVNADLSDEDLENVDVKDQYDGKIGTKKLRKLEEKAARKAQREVRVLLLNVVVCFNVQCHAVHYNA